MATVNYYLKGAFSEKRIESLQDNDQKFLNLYYNTPLQIVLKVNMSGSRLQIYTKRRIEPKYWIKEKQQVNCKKLKMGCTELNDWLTEFKKAVNLKCIQLEASTKRITKQDLNILLNQFSLKKSTKKTIDDYADFFLTEHKTKSGHPLKPGTIKKYKTLFNHINTYCESEGIRPYIEHANVDFIKGFRVFMLKSLNLSDNTTAKYIKECKTFFTFLSKKGKTEPIDFSDIKTIENEGEVYTLTIEEVLHLQDMDFKNSKLNAVRDIFCFQCWTGQRISDIINIKWDDIHSNKLGEKVWDFISVKGEERVKVPIISKALTIISKYENDPLPLPLMSTQKINQYLKEIGEKAGLTRKVRKVRYYDGEINIEYVPFYKILTTHIARKSYITNSLILDIPERIVRSISKHKNERSFKRYVEISEEYKNQKIREVFEKI